MRTDRALHAAARFMAFWSFATLVATAQLSWGAVAFGCLAFGALFLKPGLLQAISDRMWRAVNLSVAAAVALYAAYDVGMALIYLTVYAQINKLARYKTPRDYIWLFPLCLFQVVLAGAITVDLLFLLMLIVFVTLSIVALALLTLERMRHEAERKLASAGRIGQPLAGLPDALADQGDAQPGKVKPGRLPRTYLRQPVAILVAVVLLGSFIFAMVPRLAVRKVFMRLRPFDTEAVTRFTEEVLLGRLSDVRRDRTVVMRVWIGRGGSQFSAPLALRLRGVALDYFDGEKWLPSRWAFGRQRFIGAMAARRSFQVPFAYKPERMVRMAIEIDLSQTDNWLFGPPFVSRIDFSTPMSFYYFPQIHAFRAARSSPETRIYNVLAYAEPSMIQIASMVRGNASRAGRPVANPAARRTSTYVMPPKVRQRYTFLPANLPEKERIAQLARQVTRTASSDLERVGALNRFFHGQGFRYSLTSRGPTGRMFLAHFLFREREGHCEAFATAMATLCRMVGVPARVVSGYYTTEFNRFERFFYVRQCHAHTWVEAWLDGFGWMTVDPSPPSALTPELSRFAFLTVLRDYWDSWTVKWRRYVIDYSLADQMRILRRAWFVTATPLLGLRAANSSLAGIRQRFGKSGRALSSLWLLTVPLLGWLLYRRQMRRNNHQLAGVSRRSARAPGFYGRILAALASEGWRKPPDQTPAEFVRAVVAVRPELADLVALTHAYYRVRFNGGALRDDERALAESVMARIATRRSLKRLLGSGAGTCK